MPDTTTTNYGYTKPEVGAATDSWGGSLNGNWDALDGHLKVVSDVADAALPATSYTAADVLAKLLTVDTDASGLNASNVRGVTPGDTGLAILADVTPSDVRTEIGLGTLATADTVNDGDWSGTDLAVANGGTGASTASGARTNLGLGSLATQSSIDTNDISGDVDVAHGGTGASTATSARANLGLVIGTNVAPYDNDIAEIAALANTDGNFIVGNGTQWVAEGPSTARASLGLGSSATYDQSTSAVINSIARRNSSGDLVAVDFNATSDKRLKEEIGIIDGDAALDCYSRLGAYRYLKNGIEGIGVYAQELQSTMFGCLVKEGDDGFLTVTYDGLHAGHIAALTRLDERLTALEEVAL